MERPLADLTYVVKELPLGPSFPTGQLHDISSGMRTFRPVIDTEKCVKCLRCFLVCPDGAIDKSGAALTTARAAAYATAPASWALSP